MDPSEEELREKIAREIEAMDIRINGGWATATSVRSIAAAIVRRGGAVMGVIVPEEPLFEDSEASVSN